jgi:hypothetical protein
MASLISAGTTSGTALNMSGDTSGVLQLASNNGTTAVTIDTSQNVGIGGTGYTEKLTVNGAIVSKGTATANQTSAIALDATYSSSVSAIRAWGASGTTASIVFLTGSGGSNDTERMRIDSSGNLLVGKTSVGTGTAGVEISGTNQYIGSTRASNPTAVFNRQGSSGTNIEIQFQNSVCGTISVNSGTTAYNTSSDYRLKENIAPITGALTKVAQLKPVTYKWKIDGSGGEGFIAHELAEVCPQAVHGTKDEVDADGKPVYQGIDVSFLVATLTAALQETKALIDTQAETINALTARIVAIESKA